MMAGIAGFEPAKMPESKSGALPLGYIPLTPIFYHKAFVLSRCFLEKFVSDIFGKATLACAVSRDGGAVGMNEGKKVGRTRERSRHRPLFRMDVDLCRFSWFYAFKVPFGGQIGHIASLCLCNMPNGF